jgi:hypothetical protein
VQFWCFCEAFLRTNRIGALVGAFVGAVAGAFLEALVSIKSEHLLVLLHEHWYRLEYLLAQLLVLVRSFDTQPKHSSA